MLNPPAQKGTVVKKQVITEQEIRRELLAKINILKPSFVFLTVCAIIGMVLYPIHLIRYLNGTPFEYDGGLKSPPLAPAAAMILIPILIPILIIAFLLLALWLYYIPLYKIRKGKFEVIEEPLCTKEKEFRYHPHNSKEEYALYFRHGRIAVQKEIYAHAERGDVFYLVVINGKKDPLLCYHTKFCEYR